MLTFLRTENVGPAKEMTLEFGNRLNILTGDNGLGKSFILDMAWWAMTRRWPAELNPKLLFGNKALPRNKSEGRISFSFEAETATERYTSVFNNGFQAWLGRKGRPANPGLVIYAMSDGSYAVWDPYRNYWRNPLSVDMEMGEDNEFIVENLKKERPPAYVFSPNEVWYGLRDSEGRQLCNGLLLDWTLWQKEGKAPFEHLRRQLKALSPEAEDIVPGELGRLNVSDVKDIPTIKSANGEEVLIVHASSGLRRIMAMAYMLVWVWEEHKRAAHLLNKSETGRITFLIDEVEAHLHPKWQRTIIPTLLESIKTLVDSNDIGIQLIATTHSPLVMSSLEPEFNNETDAWFDLNIDDNGNVTVQKQNFIKHGTASYWLTSEAFDLHSAYSKKAETVMDEARQFMRDKESDFNRAKDINTRLQFVLSDIDPFWIGWRSFCDRNGYAL